MVYRQYQNQIGGLSETFKKIEAKVTKKIKGVGQKLSVLKDLGPKLAQLERNDITQGDFLDAQVRSIKEEVLSFQAKVDSQFGRQWAEIQKLRTLDQAERSAPILPTAPDPQFVVAKATRAAKGAKSLKRRPIPGGDLDFDSESVFASKATREAFRGALSDK